MVSNGYEHVCVATPLSRQGPWSCSGRNLVVKECSYFLSYMGENVLANSHLWWPPLVGAKRKEVDSGQRPVGIRDQSTWVLMGSDPWSGWEGAAHGLKRWSRKGWFLERWGLKYSALNYSMCGDFWEHALGHSISAISYSMCRQRHRMVR